MYKTYFLSATVEKLKQFIETCMRRKAEQGTDKNGILRYIVSEILEYAAIRHKNYSLH